MQTLFFSFTLFFFATLNAVTFINNSNLDAKMYIVPRHTAGQFEVSVARKQSCTQSIKDFVRSLSSPRSIPWILVQVGHNPIIETYCHPSPRPMSYFEDNDERIKVIYHGDEGCETQGL